MESSAFPDELVREIAVLTPYLEWDEIWQNREIPESAGI